MNILNFMTLGILPLMRMMFGRGSPDPRRAAVLEIAFEPWGNPKPKKLMKVLRRHYPDLAEQAYAFKSLVRTNGRGSLRTLDAEEGWQISNEIEDLGFQFDSDVIEFMDRVYWNGERYMHTSGLNYCRTCCRQARIFHEHDGLMCSSCGSNDVIHAEDLTLKEFIKHVKAFPSLPVHAGSGNKRAQVGSSFTISSKDLDNDF